ncbi:predicted protein [Chaetomium globosum CBS 148.51]|uniref:Uncharacterized protein n=1 Tax=Chaetomium globosum (strain ATCC 6205 / CBS 148.51 / DSM 1962 / NBRC 6347 / NRRL 1970) TaxID=306901 RepID=Q2H5F9_CHAGB|nr:uncharacterized protein CHGG_06106 [Chaetomium globosum CBS 148.51]EAQ89487.1 predicted protein [Chaetomium globosum CBS 148.51]
MGNSYQRKPNTKYKLPIQWTDEIRHKHCGAVDIGRDGKPNKAHRCKACLAVKARESKLRNGPDDIKLGREEKMELKFGDVQQKKEK